MPVVEPPGRQRLDPHHPDRERRRLLGIGRGGERRAQSQGQDEGGQATRVGHRRSPPGLGTPRAGDQTRARRSRGRGITASAPLASSSAPSRKPQTAPTGRIPAATAVRMSVLVSPQKRISAGATSRAAAALRAPVGSGFAGTSVRDAPDEAEAPAGEQRLGREAGEVVRLVREDRDRQAAGEEAVEEVRRRPGRAASSRRHRRPYSARAMAMTAGDPSPGRAAPREARAPRAYGHAVADEVPCRPPRRGSGSRAAASTAFMESARSSIVSRSVPSRSKRTASVGIGES